MKKALLLTSLLLAIGGSFLFAGCSKDEQTEEFQPQTMPQSQMENVFKSGDQTSKMILDKKAITLTAANPTDSAIVRLECGCDFAIVPESFTGDTNTIKHSRYATPLPEAYRVGMLFTADPKAKKGNYSVKLDFLNTGSKGDYRDTITVNYTI